jgi:hypothetical protein
LTEARCTAFCDAQAVADRKTHKTAHKPLSRRSGYGGGLMSEIVRSGAICGRWRAIAAQA